MSHNKAKEALENGAQTVGVTDASAYVKRLIEDADLRDSLGRALEASRRAYDRVGKARKPGKLAEDKKLHEDVQEALDAFRQAAAGITEAPRKRAKKGLRLGRKLVVLGIGGGLALAGSEGLRSKVLDTLFGAEEEFEYTPPGPPQAAPAPPPPPAPAPVAPEPAAPPAEAASEPAAPEAEAAPEAGDAAAPPPPSEAS